MFKVIILALVLTVSSPLSLASEDWILEEHLRLLKIRCSKHLIPSLMVDPVTSNCPIRWVERGMPDGE